ncbi:hypothetical protein SELMODRAFT_439044 [Selaginella moellendorffii]|uniref:Uncharacterized protein n=1 Tax=Selaginella moellendorffii TaxID=88036 RepID=D8R205_SELML|nr:RINT1-like protein MAG2 [Selaginella moellendorffii]EFJ33986.1 hypothetical protein SELMODRAFT_439044 [Selaginella moellendorffii]|eukprot:XP_002965148.1 RINT1-like protein MAG2 [Selaginella moellendorffii]
MEVSQLLDSYFHGANDLANLHTLQQDLESECGQLEFKLQDARSRARQAAADGSAQMHAIAVSLEALCGFCEERSSSPSPPEAEPELLRELSDLAEEVSRVAQVRAYVDAVLQLERLVGDLEDGVFAAASSTPVVSRGAAGSPSSQAGQFVISAVNSLAAIEKLMGEIVECQPQWDRLISAVDVRVDRAAAALRPVVISDYRSIVISIGWPPPLSISGDRDDQQAQSHPLLQLQGDAKRKFRESFVSLSRFQAGQIQRRRREFRGYRDKTPAPREALWSIEELVHPIAANAEVHFKKWLHKPEFVFALAYRITQQHVAVVDALLQPMLDEEFLGYSAREEWISSLVAMVAEHLRRWALPTLMEDLEDALSDQASTVWLHTVDQTLSFDSKMQALVEKGIGMSSGDEQLSSSVFGVRRACIAVFSDRGDWLEVWTRLELGDARRKMAVEYGNEAAWKINSASSISGSTEFKPPLAAYRLTSAAWNLVDRCRTLPEASQRLQFVRKTALPVLDEFIDELLQRCQESEAVTALADEPSMIKVGVCLNAARYCENTVRDWCEDFFFLELRLAELQENLPGFSPAAEEQLAQIQGSVFDSQLEKLSRFRSSWSGKLVSVVSRGFDARCREYFRNKKRWSEEWAPSFEDAPSGSLVDALAALQSQLSSLKNSLDQANFVELWQRLIPSLDQLLFLGLVLGGARFSEQGARQFGADVKALFLIFRPYCARPASFFSAVSDAAKLLALDSQQALDFMERLRGYDSDEEQEEDLLAKLRSVCGVRKMTASVVYRVLGSRLL